MNTKSLEARQKTRRSPRWPLPALIRSERRGVLLLIVLSMLTLFMMLGAAYLVVATRSRETARAYAKLSLRNDNVRLPHSQIFDTVMLRVLRGVPAIESGQSINVRLAEPANSIIGPGAINPINNIVQPINSTFTVGYKTRTSTYGFESLLADKYGFETLLGTAEGTPPVEESKPVLVIPAVTFDDIPTDVTDPIDKKQYTFSATDLAGRVITILGIGRDPSSHRILRATGSGVGPYKLIVDNQPRNRPYEPVTGRSCRVVINGREFSGSGTASRPNESWDGFDEDNPFLAWVAPRDLQNETDATKVSVSSSVVKKVGFVTAASDLSQLDKNLNGFSYGADNDNDGVNDGFFLDFGLPTVISPNGDQVTLHASVLVLDLDGRVNVNAHGSLVPVVYPHTAKSGTNSNWTLNQPNYFQAKRIYDTPTGSGYGPPEVNLDLLFPTINSSDSTYNFERLQGTTRTYRSENPTVYLRTGVDSIRLADSARGGKPAKTSRFNTSGTTATPKLMNCEGRYGNYNGYVGSRFSPTIYTQMDRAQLGAGTSLYPYFIMPGVPASNDAASAISDYKPFFNPELSKSSANKNGTEYAGIPPTWWNIDTQSFNWASGNNPLGGAFAIYPRRIYNSPPDLHGRMKTITVDPSKTIDPSKTGKSPRLCFVKPEWSGTNNPEAETRDDPYELRLDTRGPRNSWLRSYGTKSPYGNLFNLSELENILRPYDIDSSKLPPRLEAMLGSVAEEARLRITTDSWDSTVVSGSAAPKLFDWARKLSDTLEKKLEQKLENKPSAAALAAEIYGATAAKQFLDGVLNREIARGERFDLNRPLTGTKPGKYEISDPYYTQRQAYFKDLYVLLCALTPPDDFNPHVCAQWVANIVEFRDGDSTMTPFEFDTNPADGWDVDGNVKTTNDANPDQRDVVFGCERPEIVIAEACAWEDEADQALYVALHRPWNATAFGIDSAKKDASIAAETCDPELDSYKSTVPQNKLDLGRKAGDNAKNSSDNTDTSNRDALPIWRLRIRTDGQPDTFVRLDVDETSKPNNALPPELVLTAPIARSPTIEADETIYLVPNSPGKAYVNVTGKTVKFQELKVPGPKQTYEGKPRDATVFLERLADPRATPQFKAPIVSDDDWRQDPEKTPPKSLKADQLSRMAIYRTVDQVPIKVANLCKDPVTSSIPITEYPKLTHRGDSMWKQGAPGEPSTGLPIQLADSWEVKTPKWFFWPNRPFVASPELLFVHALDSQSLLMNYSDPKPQLAPDPDPKNWTWGPTVLRNLKSPPLFDAVHVPTRFAGIHATTSDPNGNLATLAGIDQVTTPVNQLSAFREPGRVNLNTVTADDVWNAVVAGPLVKPDGSPDPVDNRANAAFNTTPARNTSSLLFLTGQQPAATDPQRMPKTDGNAALISAIDLNPSQAIYTANRLANTATTKSHLFGVWITLREAMAPAPAAGQPVVPADPDGVRYHRAFYVIDRSIPVAHEPGRDHNVWDAVLLRRIVE